MEQQAHTEPTTFYRFVTESDRKHCSEFEQVYIELMCSQHYDEACRLHDQYEAELASFREVARLEGWDELYDFSLSLWLSRIRLRAMLDRVRMLVRHKNELVRAGLWRSSANVRYTDELRVYDRELGMIRQLSIDIGLLVDEY